MHGARAKRCALGVEDADLRDVAAAWEAAMRRGDFEAAWRQTDRLEHLRRAREACGAPIDDCDHLLWNGASFAGRRVLVRCNHGLGDTLQFIRYVPRLREVARRVSVLVQPHLVELLQCPEFGDVQNGWTDASPPPHDVEIEIMELAYAFRSTIETLPRRVPYISLSNVRAFAHLLPPLPRAAGCRIGLVWASSEWDTSRSVPLSTLAPLGSVPGVRFFGLQQGAHAEPAVAAPFAITVLSPHTKEIRAAAAAMLELDLVITVDCMVAHLAGALGRPAWLLLKHRADWRWMDGRDDSPWYPTLRLFRQSREGDWRTVIARVAEALDRAVKGSDDSPRAMPLS